MILLVGASASGKTAVGKYLDTKYGIKKVVTYTTREKRINEIEGVDYFFVSKDEFLRNKEDGFFFETMEYQNNYYGTPKAALNNSSYIIVDPKGLDFYKKNLEIESIAFFLYCSKEERAKRMRIRMDEPSSITKRLESDDDLFSEKNLNGNVDVIIDCTKLSIEEIAKKIISVYSKKFGING